MPELSDEELNALVEEATVDAYGDDEQLGVFAVMIEDNLEVPFKTTVVGVTVTVQKVTQTESGIVADCVRDGHHQAISVLDLRCPSRRRKARSGSPPTGTGRVAREGVPGREDVLGRTGQDRLGGDGPRRRHPEPRSGKWQA